MSNKKSLKNIQFEYEFLRYEWEARKKQDLEILKLIKAIEARNMDASTLFAAMLNEIAIDADYEDIESEDYEYE